MTPTILYRFFDADDQLLYVGVAGTATQRWEQHAKEKGWWRDVAKTTVDHHPSRPSAMAAERNALRAEKPKYNVVHNDSRPHLPKHDFEWYCDLCRAPVADGGGYIQSLKAMGRRWVVLHRECDPFPDDPGYWISVERYRKEIHEREWFCHLHSKRWFDLDDWDDLLHRSMRWAHDSPPRDLDHGNFFEALRLLAHLATNVTQEQP